jgi:ParB family chromosome partitioning protein
VLREVGGDTVAQAHAAEKGKTIKGVINDDYPDRRAMIAPRLIIGCRAGWRSRPSAYTQRGGVATVAAANRVKWQAEADEQTDPDPEAAAFLPEPGNDADETAEVLDADEAEVEPERQAA